MFSWQKQRNTQVKEKHNFSIDWRVQRNLTLADGMLRKSNGMFRKEPWFHVEDYAKVNFRSSAPKKSHDI